MKKSYGLTYTEMEIMEFLWSQEKGVSFKEILIYVNEKLHKDWKRQTLSTYLKNLQMTGLVKAIDSKKIIVIMRHARKKSIYIIGQKIW